MASATSAGSPRISVMPAACMATSVPVAIAMPISAAASAGASLMPSPTIATHAGRSAFSRAITRGLVRRAAPRRGRRRCRARCATACGAAAVVAGEQHAAMPSACSRAIAAARGRLDVSPKASRPSTRGCRRRCSRQPGHGVALRLQRRRARRPAACGTRRRVRPAARVAQQRGRGRRPRAVDAAPGQRAQRCWPWPRRSPPLRPRRQHRPRQRMLAAAPARPRPAPARSAASTPSTGIDAVTAGRPSVSVPVLSNATIVDADARVPAPRRP